MDGQYHFWGVLKDEHLTLRQMLDLKPNQNVNEFDKFVVFQKEMASRARYKGLEIPLLFQYGNALNIGMAWYGKPGINNEIIGSDGINKDKVLQEKKTLKIYRGESHRKLAKPQIEGKMWLRRDIQYLYGPDEYFRMIVIPLGPQFYYHLFCMEMRIVVDKFLNSKNKKFVEVQHVLEHDFNKCNFIKNRIVKLLKKEIAQRKITKKMTDDLSRFKPEKKKKTKTKKTKKTK